MEPKKKPFLVNLRLKPKLPNLKKKKAAGKPPKKLAYRRSISVPNLNLIASEFSPSDGNLMSGASDAVFFGSTPPQSDSDSIASGYLNSDSISLTDGMTDLVPVARQTANQAVLGNKLRASVERGNLYEEIDNNVSINSCSMSKQNLTNEALYAQVDRSAKINKADSQISKSNLFPIAAPRSVPTNLNVVLTRPPMSADRENLDGSGSTPTNKEVAVMSSGVAALKTRATSFGEHYNFHTEKQPATPEQHRLDRVTPLGTKDGVERWSLPGDCFWASGEGTDGISLDSTCGTSNDERVVMPSNTDSEDQEREMERLPLFMSEIYSKLEEEPQLEETPRDMLEMSSEQSDLFEEVVRDPSDISASVGPRVPANVPIQRYLLNINLKEGRNLVIKNKRSGTSDPYVKFKFEGKQFYKSKVSYKNLNPHWNESFSHPLRDREHVVEARVYDKNRTSDEFMGSTTISLKNLELYKNYEMELRLENPKSKENSMGTIVVDVYLMFRDATIKRSPRWAPKKNKAGQPQNQVQTVTPAQTQSQVKNPVWTGVFSITLVEGLDLPQHGQADVYVRFRLGDQKYKSKNLCIQANPQWREKFDFNHFEENQDPLQVEVYSKRGRKSYESWGMFEVDLSRVQVHQRQLYTHVLDPGKGRLVFLVILEPCWGVSVSDIAATPLEQPDERNTIEEKFNLMKSFNSLKEVGFLQVKVIKAADLVPVDINGRSNPFCVIELGNSKLQTQTIPKTHNPEWNKVFTFPIKDIHDVVELTVFDENGDKAPNFLGKVAIPLLSVQNGQQICRLLKKECLSRPNKGSITLVLEVIYNHIRAGIRTFQPKEDKFIDQNIKFSKKELAQNIYRVRRITTAVLYTLQYIKSCFQWESRQRSLMAFLIFLVTMWHGELFMLPLFLLLLIGCNYFLLSSGRGSSSQDLVNMNMTDDDEEEDEKEIGKKGLMDKIHMVQEVVLTVQTILDEIANIGERVKNTFNWSVPFLSCLACLVLLCATTLMYFVPLRYIVLIWGVNKFTKKLRSPHAIDNNEMLEFFKRVPSDVQKVRYSKLRATSTQSPARRKK